MRLRTVDLECTGLAPPAEVCEIAFCDIDENGQELARFQSFVKPYGAIPPESCAVHHITDAELLGAPRWPQVKFHIAHAFPKPNALIAHHMSFERQWLGDVWSGIPFLCTYKAALRVWPDAPRHSNSVLRY